MNWLLRVFGMRDDDWERIVVRTCPACGQPVCEERQVRPLSDMERIALLFERDEIDTAELERRVLAALHRGA